MPRALIVSIAGVPVAALALLAWWIWRYRLLGAINGRYFRRAPLIDDPAIGRSRGLPIALSFRVGEGATGFPAGIGRVVHRALFAGSPDFTVNIKFACARPDLFGRSDFANPGSIWYNVFIGYYQVEVPREAWGRPFGYDLDEAGVPSLRLEEMARLVRADWNHLSNQLYGVPESATRPINALGFDELRASHGPRVRREGWDGAWDLAEFESMRVVGPYAGSAGRNHEDASPLIRALWRRCFGTWAGHASDESYAPCLLRLRAYLCFKATVNERGAPVYRTFVFGSSVNQRYDEVDPVENARFLALQMRELEEIIRGERGVGFA